MSSRLHRRATMTAATVVLAAGATAPAWAATQKPPTVTTLPADPTLITDSYALLSGNINPNGLATAYHFEYGPTTSYGTLSPDLPAGNGKADVPVDYAVDDLAPATTYHYQLVAFPDSSTNGAYASIGQVPGGDQSFTTSPALAVSFFKDPTGRVDVTGRVKLVLKAVGPADEVVKGKLKIVAKFKTSPKAKSKTRTIATKPFRIKVGAIKPYKLKLGAVARKYLSENDTLTATVSVGKTLTQKLTLKG